MVIYMLWCAESIKVTISDLEANCPVIASSDKPCWLADHEMPLGILFFALKLAGKEEGDGRRGW